MRSPDLDKQKEFLLDFGTVRAARTKTALYMRGTDLNHLAFEFQDIDDVMAGHAMGPEAAREILPPHEALNRA